MLNTLSDWISLQVIMIYTCYDLWLCAQNLRSGKDVWSTGYFYGPDHFSPLLRPHEC